MVSVSSQIWPDFNNISDSSEDEDDVVVQKADENKCSRVTEEEINGDFPAIFVDGKKDSDSSGDDDNENEDRPAVKRNPYLAHMDDSNVKYTNQLRDLNLKRNEARKLNHQQVSEEDQRKKLPANYEARRKRAEWELQDKEARKLAKEAGEDYDEIKRLEETAEEIEIFDRRKRKKKNQDPGFADYASSQLRQYERLTQQMKPDLERYNDSKEKLGVSVFPGAHNLRYGGSDRPSKEAIDRMVGDLQQQIDKRSKYHRRRQYHEDADVDYINERNMKFNQKAERYYGQYTQEIKENLERGTAI